MPEQKSGVKVGAFLFSKLPNPISKIEIDLKKMLSCAFPQKFLKNKLFDKESDGHVS